MFVIGLYIIIYKRMYIGRAAERSARFTDSFWKSRDIEQIYKQAQALRNSPISQMFVAGYTELAKLASDEQLKDDREGNLANIERALRRAQTVETTQARVDGAVPRDHRLGRAVHRPVRHRDRHPVRVPRHRRFARKRRPRRSRPSARTSPRRCSRPRSASSPRSPRSWRTTTSCAASSVLRSEMEMFEQDYLNIIKRHFLR